MQMGLVKARIECSSKLQRNSAIDNQFEARNVFRLVRSEVQAGIGNIPGVAHVPHRALSVSNLPHLLDVALSIFRGEAGSLLNHWGLHKTGEDGVHPDMFRRILHSS